MKHTEKTDNRWSQRQGVSLNITLQDNGEELLQTTSRDISIGGILVATEDVQLDIDRRLNVEFTLRNARGEQRHSLPARVVRRHDNATALAFSDYDIPALDALRVLLYDGAASH